MCAKTKVVTLGSGGLAELMKAACCGESFPADGDERDIADATLKVMNQFDGRSENGYRFCEKIAIRITAKAYMECLNA